MDKNHVSGSFLQIVGILLQPLGLFFVLFFFEKSRSNMWGIDEKKIPAKMAEK